MKPTLNAANVVVIASSFNPSIVTKDWLLSKGIVKEHPEDFTHTPGFSFYKSENFAITLFPDRLQLELRKINQNNIEELTTTAKRFISFLPETPYVAVGTNYRWQIEGLTEGDIKDKLRELFTFNWNKFPGLFSEKEVTLGLLMWQKYNKFLMRLTIEPNLRTMIHILCSFNYHANIRGSEEVQQRLAETHLTLSHSKSVVNEMFGER